MNYAIIGFGKMGKLFQEVMKERGMNIIDIVDPHVNGMSNWNHNRLRDADLAFAFTPPGTGRDVAQECMRAGCDVVLGTTEFCELYDGSEDIEKLSALHADAVTWGKRLFYAANFSPAVNAFFRKIKDISPEMAQEGYQPFVVEVHHKGKTNDVSGTAKTLGRLIMAGYESVGQTFDGLDFDIERAIWPEGFEEYQLDLNADPDMPDWDYIALTREVRKKVAEARTLRSGRLPLVAVRFGDVAGIHQVYFMDERSGDIVETFREVSQGRRDYVDGALDDVPILLEQAPGVYNRNLRVGLPVAEDE
ncbi:hypothetical protein HN592_03775 [Candidatus Woesearchaeota archaeon]|jgi:dihydrodipicolinate reductase|nr:hypothetical protein [Candidatus Woesearchaeota archaeon]MBT4368332.1 hypothetical protein [Candidatus Woesearchaeota archaeon]MBT4712821.1 hypothetical protein [Candidatus Woesearchaeota archaeon]MBT6639733.1 hypothetical protein [Candidatus Woesearchaeota archaeon]MBT7133905.1 hypothetical protein [Candidatus Woesearchaeota archaeon]